MILEEKIKLHRFAGMAFVFLSKRTCALRQSVSSSRSKNSDCFTSPEDVSSIMLL